MTVKIEWLGHASFRFVGTKTVYADPWKIGPGPAADLMIVTHPHYDHLSAPDVAKIRADHTTIVTTTDCARQLEGSIKEVGPGDMVQLGPAKVECVPAYNPQKKFHPRANNWIGYILDMDGVRIYQASDTDLIPEMRDLKDIDYALLPVGGTYTMDAAEAAKAADIIKPRVAAIPYHYGDIVGTGDDARRFKKLARCRVDILEKVE